MNRAGIQIYRWEGGLFNALCAIYFVTLGPLVVEAADRAMRIADSKVYWLGFLIIGISLAEVYAFPAKLRFVRMAVREYGDSIGAGFILWMFHAVISIILLFLTAGAFGVEISGSSGSEMTPATSDRTDVSGSLTSFSSVMPASPIQRPGERSR